MTEAGSKIVSGDLLTSYKPSHVTGDLALENDCMGISGWPRQRQAWMRSDGAKRPNYIGEAHGPSCFLQAFVIKRRTPMDQWIGVQIIKVLFR